MIKGNERRDFRFAIGLALVLAAAGFVRAQTEAPAEIKPATPAAPTTPANRTGAGLPAGVTAKKDVVYAEVGERKLKIDLFLPGGEDGKTASPRPVVLWIHGGGWEGGSKDRAPGTELLKRGYILASVEYRLTGVASFPAQIYDCKGAVRWLRAHAAEYNIDPARVGVWGASAGGHLAALMGTTGGLKDLEGDIGGNLDQSSRVQAVVDWFGPTDMLTLAAPNPDATDQQKQAFAVGLRVVEKFMGGSTEQKRDVYIQASPTTHITPDDPPMLIMHGDADPLVPLSQSQLLETKLKAAKVPVELDVIKGAGHGSLGPTGTMRVADWFDEHLKKKPADKPVAAPK
ncbi:MAG: alpha/beta hydrolase fold domain-containing protein [Phycisphaerales bacterium]